VLDLKTFDKLVNTKDQDIYLKIKGKIRCDVEKYSYEEAEKFNATAWWVHDDYVVIDVDIKNHASILYNIVIEEGLNCHVFRSIKGAHFVFKERPGFPVPQVVGCYSAIGLQFDTRTSEKGYIVLPHNQDDRKWMKLAEGKLDELPMWLFPQKKLTNAYKESIVDEESGKKKKADIMPKWCKMSDGDGRNDELFRYFNSLIKLKLNMTVNEKRESIEILNEYVLKTPLEDSELHATVLRKELTEDLPQDEIDHGQELDRDIIANKSIGDEEMHTKNDLIYIFKEQ